MILVFMRTMYAAERERPEKYRPELESDPELCDICQFNVPPFKLSGQLGAGCYVDP